LLGVLPLPGVTDFDLVDLVLQVEVLASGCDEAIFKRLQVLLPDDAFYAFEDDVDKFNVKR
jgi:hypothetical protein